MNGVDKLVNFPGGFQEMQQVSRLLRLLMNFLQHKMREFAFIGVFRRQGAQLRSTFNHMSIANITDGIRSSVKLNEFAVVNDNNLTG